MTPEQRATLVAHIRANVDPAVVAALGGGPIGRNDTELCRLYNLPKSPDFHVWRSSVTLDEIMSDGFDWVLVDNLSVGKARIWEWLFDNDGSTIDARKSNVRAGIAECWKGTAAMLAQQANILGHCKRAVSLFESLYTTGTGSLADPGIADLEGEITIDEMGRAFAENP